VADWGKVSVGFPGLEKSPFSRFSPALEPRFTLRGADVVEALERVGRRIDDGEHAELSGRLRVGSGRRSIARVSFDRVAGLRSSRSLAFNLPFGVLLRNGGRRGAAGLQPLAREVVVGPQPQTHT
jgi:hypothetical protein